MADKMALEKKIDLLVDKFDGLSTKVDGVITRVDGLSTKVDGLTTRVDGLTVQVGGLATRVGGLATQVNRLEGQFGGFKEEFGGFKQEFGELKSRVAIGFEESHRLMKLSLEGLAGLEETTIERFDKMTVEHADQVDLLKKVDVHVRRRVERLEATHRRARGD